MWPPERGPPPVSYPARSVTAFYTPQGSFESHQLLDRDYSANYTSAVPYVQENWESVHSPRDFLAGNTLLEDQDWLSQRYSRRVNVSEYKKGEVVVVRCNQHKWLFGVIKRMSARGVRVWVADAHLMVNVPLELLHTHLLKMSAFAELTALPPSAPTLTVATVDDAGYGRVRVQCVRPAHLSHRQLYHMLGCFLCAICKTPLPPTADVAAPWGCQHRAHGHCLRLRAQHSSTSSCPSCEESAARQLGVPLPAARGLLPPPPPGPATTGLCNWAELHCVCGFWGSIPWYGDAATTVCPNCHRAIQNNMATGAVGYASPGHRDSGVAVYGRGASLLGAGVRASDLNGEDEGAQTMVLYGMPHSPGRLEAIDEGGEGMQPPSANSSYKEDIHDMGIDQDDSMRMDPRSRPSSYSAGGGADLGPPADVAQYFQDDAGAAGPSLVLYPNDVLVVAGDNPGQNGRGPASLYYAAQVPNPPCDDRGRGPEGSVEFVQGGEPASSVYYDEARGAELKQAEFGRDALGLENGLPSPRGDVGKRIVDDREMGVTDDVEGDAERLWRRESTVAWAGDDATSSVTESDIFAAAAMPAVPPVYVNHFAAFFNLATRGAASDLAFSRQMPRGGSQGAPGAPGMSLGAPNPLDEGEAPTWVTVIKDGKVDAKKDEKQLEMERSAKAKESEFS